MTKPGLIGKFANFLRRLAIRIAPPSKARTIQARLNESGIPAPTRVLAQMIAVRILQSKEGPRKGPDSNETEDRLSFVIAPADKDKGVNARVLRFSKLRYPYDDRNTPKAYCNIVFTEDGLGFSKQVSFKDDDAAIIISALITLEKILEERRVLEVEAKKNAVALDYIEALAKGQETLDEAEV